jgi:hypothetical protein
MTLEELGRRFDDLVAATMRIADALEAIELYLRNRSRSER